jgi:tetratricopeptide (TPR) repeat protein
MKVTLMQLRGWRRAGAIGLGATAVVAASYLIESNRHDQAIDQLTSGQAHAARGDWLPALACFDRALWLDRWLSEVRLLRGTSINESIGLIGKPPRGGTREDALNDLELYLLDHPNSGEAHYQRGIALSGLAKKEPARAALGRATELLADPTDALVERAALSFHAGDYATAVKEISGAIERHPFVAEYYESHALYRRFVPDLRGSSIDSARADRLRAAADPKSLTVKQLDEIGLDEADRDAP